MIQKIIFLYCFIIFIFTNCSEPARVVITSHENDMVVSEIVTISCESFEKSEISKIQLFVDGNNSLVEDNTEPWILKWNTIKYDDQSNHFLNILAYGPNGDSSYSDTLFLTVDNSNSYPEKVAISKIELNDKGFDILWDKSSDSDFSKYILEKGNKKSLSDSKVIFESNIITDNRFRDIKVNPLKYQYYRISVEDYVGYQTKGDIFSSDLEKLPSSVKINSIDYDNEKMTVSWERSSDSDFSHYLLYTSGSLTGKKKRIKKISLKNKTSFVLNEFNPTKENWFWVETIDKHGYKTMGTGLSNIIDNYPNASIIESVIYNETELNIDWSLNSDNDFKSYEIIMSNEYFQDSSIAIIADQSINQLSIIEFDPTIKNDFLVKTTDIWGQQTISSIVSNKIDLPPNQIIINKLKFVDTSLYLEWNKSDEDNFKKYYICHTHDLSISPDTVAIYDNQDIISHKLVSGFDPNIDNWLWIIVEDTRNQSSISPPQIIKNKIPSKSEISLKQDDDEDFYISWNKNFDEDFNRYILYHSQNPDMNNKQIVFEADNYNDNSFKFLIQDQSKINYFQIVVEDIFKMKFKSDLVSGVPNDLQVLLDIVIENNLNIIPSELGTQVWENGRLLELSIGKWSDGGEVTIHILPESFGTLKYLNSLWLSYNNLNSLPDSFSNLKLLEILELRYNNFNQIPNSINNLNNLKYLGFSYNNINFIPEWINNLVELRKLFLSHNKLTEIKESICELKLDYNEMGDNFLSQNQICIPFLLPDCVKKYYGDQNCITE